MIKAQKPELITKMELKRLTQIAAKSVGYEDSFGIEGCDLNLNTWASAYIRQSLEEQAKNNRIPEYLRTCALLAKNEDVKVPMEYIIIDHESSSYLDRKFMKYLRKELIQKRKIKKVIIPAQGRLIADAGQQSIFETECNYYGVEYIFGDAPSGSDWASQTGRLIMAQANALRIKTNRDSARAGNIGRVLKGMVPAGRAPFGYKYCREAVISSSGRTQITDAWWEIDELDADGSSVYLSPAWAVSQIFHWVGNEDKTSWWVANKLKQLKVQTPNGGQWKPSRVANILHNRCYTGEHAYNVYERVPNPENPLVDFTAEIKRTLDRPKPESEWVHFEVPAIVSKDLWEKANAKTAKRGRGRGKQGKSIEALLRNRLLCPRCGKPLVVRRNRHHRVYYYCSRHGRSWADNPCSYNRFIPGDEWDDLVWEDVCSWLKDEIWVEQQILSEQSQDENIVKLINNHQVNIAKIKAKISRVREGFEGGIYDLNEAKGRVSGFQSAISKEEMGIQRLQERLNAIGSHTVNYDEIKNNLRVLRDRNLCEASFDDKVDIISKLGISVCPSEDLSTMKVTCQVNLQQLNSQNEKQNANGKGELNQGCGKVMVGEPPGTRTRNTLIKSQKKALKLLNKLTVTELAKLSNFSKSSISQFKSGRRSPSPKLIEALLKLSEPSVPRTNYVSLFIKSRRYGLSPRTIEFYRGILYSAEDITQPDAKPQRINNYLKHLSGNAGNKNAHYRALRAFFNWLYSPNSDMGFSLQDNPILYVESPKVPKRILPSLSKEDVLHLIEEAETIRDKAIIALFTESGLRLSELTNITPKNINWKQRVIRVIGKGNKEALAPFGKLSEYYLQSWLNEYKPRTNIWGIDRWGVINILRKLRDKTELPCNPHTFRRTFACLLRKAGIDTMTIKDLGRWESLEMVQRYTRSIGFNDSLRLYKAPLC
ncbi:tyrosine-type recombinase/integrase [Chloroflexota bacterium]